VAFRYIQLVYALLCIMRPHFFHAGLGAFLGAFEQSDGWVLTAGKGTNYAYRVVVAESHLADEHGQL
jgi:hypothetical protein